jgi:uncharacterized protein YuzE
MRVEYDQDVDAAYIYFVDDIPAPAVARTISIDPQAINGMVNLDLDDRGRIVGLEVLDASKLLPPELLGIDES